MNTDICKEMVVKNYISFIEIKNLIKNLLSLLIANKWLKIQEPTLPDFKKVEFFLLCLYFPDPEQTREKNTRPVPMAKSLLLLQSRQRNNPHIVLTMREFLLVLCIYNHCVH